MVCFSFPFGLSPLVRDPKRHSVPFDPRFARISTSRRHCHSERSETRFRGVELRSSAVRRNPGGTLAQDDTERKTLELLQFSQFYDILITERLWGYEFLYLQYNLLVGCSFHIHVVSHQRKFLSSRQQEQQNLYKEKQKRLFELLALQKDQRRRSVGLHILSERRAVALDLAIRERLRFFGLDKGAVFAHSDMQRAALHCSGSCSNIFRYILESRKPRGEICRIG